MRASSLELRTELYHSRLGLPQSRSHLAEELGAAVSGEDRGVLLLPISVTPEAACPPTDFEGGKLQRGSLVRIGDGTGWDR